MLCEYMNTNNIAIVIPIYSETLEEQEIISLKQAKTIFEKYDIIAAAPTGLSIEERSFSRIESFDADFFTSVNAYNRLMLSPEFYRRFQDYEYILIYQLDAFVFSDRLQYFCDLGYDYIGAPWLHGIFNYVDASHYLWHVGNGGFSLRKVAGFINILEKKNPLQSDLIKNEDLYFSSIVDDGFKVAPKEIALQFSFERQVQKCFELNQNRLPFGCHAWARYDLPFWKQYIEQFGFHVQETQHPGKEDVVREKEYLFWEKFANLFKNENGIMGVNQKLISRFGQTQKSYIIFGAGFYGKGISSWLTDAGISIKCFCDNNMELEGKTVNGYPIIHADRLQKYKDKSLVIIINYQFENQIAEQLEAMNFEREKNFITFTDFVKLLE